MSDAGLACLARMPALEALDLSGCAGVSAAGLALLGGLPALRWLGAPPCAAGLAGAEGPAWAPLREQQQPPPQQGQGPKQQQQTALPFDVQLAALRAGGASPGPLPSPSARTWAHGP